MTSPDFTDIKVHENSEAVLQEALKQGKISYLTFNRVKVAKEYIEKKYTLKMTKHAESKKEWEVINEKIDFMNVDSLTKHKIKQEILKREAEVIRLKRQKMSVYDYKPLDIIGKGAFGEVRVCQNSKTNEIVAIKKLKKEEMHRKNQIIHVRTEKEILTRANEEWIVGLKCSFQDENFLYLVMDYMPGGDLMSQLIKKDIFKEEEGKFYVAELISAVESIHKLNCIHRDLKPDNILLDSKGHIKLSDFGLCKVMDSDIYCKELISSTNFNLCDGNSVSNNNNNQEFLRHKKIRRAFAHSTVGTPDYIAPEIFRQKGYGPEVDWWSIGVILFEMIIGYPPFYGNTPTETCHKILNWQKYLSFPPKSKVSKEAIDLMRGLITDVDKRLGYNGAEEIKKHPFFKGIDWKNLKKMTPPFVPLLENMADTKYFDKFEETEPFHPKLNKEEKDYTERTSVEKTERKNSKRQTKKDICFVDFTYKKETNTKPTLINAIEIINNIKRNFKDINDEIAKEHQNFMQKKKAFETGTSKIKLNTNITSNSNNNNQLNNNDNEKVENNDEEMTCRNLIYNKLYNNNINNNSNNINNSSNTQTQSQKKLETIQGNHNKFIDTHDNDNVSNLNSVIPLPKANSYREQIDKYVPVSKTPINLKVKEIPRNMNLINNNNNNNTNNIVNNLNHSNSKANLNNHNLTAEKLESFKSTDKYIKVIKNSNRTNRNNKDLLNPIASTSLIKTINDNQEIFKTQINSAREHYTQTCKTQDRSNSNISNTNNITNSNSVSMTNKTKKDSNDNENVSSTVQTNKIPRMKVKPSNINPTNTNNYNVVNAGNIGCTTTTNNYAQKLNQDHNVNNNNRDKLINNYNINYVLPEQFKGKICNFTPTHDSTKVLDSIYNNLEREKAKQLKQDQGKTNNMPRNFISDRFNKNKSDDTVVDEKHQIVETQDMIKGLTTPTTNNTNNVNNMEITSKNIIKNDLDGHIINKISSFKNNIGNFNSIINRDRSNENNNTGNTINNRLIFNGNLVPKKGLNFGANSSNPSPNHYNIKNIQIKLARNSPNPNINNNGKVVNTLNTQVLGNFKNIINSNNNNNNFNTPDNNGFKLKTSLITNTNNVYSSNDHNGLKNKIPPTIRITPNNINKTGVSFKKIEIPNHNSGKTIIRNENDQNSYNTNNTNYNNNNKKTSNY